MQVNNNSDFVTYTISEQEQLNGTILNYLQKAVIQNERMRIMEQLVQLTPENMNTSGQETYWQQEAYLRGQLDIYTHLLTASKAAELTVDPDAAQE